MSMTRGRRERLFLSLLACTIIVGLPMMTYRLAKRQDIGPTLVEFDFGWLPGSGIHAGDLVALAILLPIWIAAVAYLVGTWRSSS